jgi:hypothetical protein
LGGLSLPIPYPDELIASVLARAVIHNGLAPKRLLTRLLGRTGKSNFSMFLPTNLPVLAAQTRMDEKTLLWDHTVFPYSVAFMPPAEVLRLEQKVLGGCTRDQGSTASLVKSVTHSLPEFRYCDRCVQKDLRETGESYWHRVHCLPGVKVCIKHSLPLKGVAVRPQTFAQYLQMPLPHRQDGHVGPMSCSLELLHSIAKTTAAICSGQWVHRSEWLSTYRARATALQLTLPNGLVASARLAFELHKIFGEDFLVNVGCEYKAFGTAWPGLMVREGSKVPFAPVKHVFLDGFLKHYRLSDSAFSYRKPGKTPLSASMLDRWLATEVQKRADAAARLKGLITVRHLLEDTGKWHFFRHNRLSLPLTVAQVEAFKRSEASQRKSGGREAHSKKLQAIAEGRQKPFMYVYRLRKKRPAAGK